MANPRHRGIYAYGMFAAPPVGDENYVLAGDGVPPVDDGVVGDMYIDGTTDNLYGPKTAGGWGTPRPIGATPGGSGGTFDVYRDVAGLKADTTPYGPDRVVGGRLDAGSHSYIIEPAIATGAQLLVTAGNVKLQLQKGADGYYSVDGFDVRGDNSVGDRARWQAAAEFTPFLSYSAKTYEFNEYVTVPDFYKQTAQRVHLWGALVLTGGKSAIWKGVAGQTVLALSAAVQASADQNDVCVVFIENAEHFQAPGITIDERAVRQGFGAPFAIYGVENVLLDGIKCMNCNPFRIGASETVGVGYAQGSCELFNCVGTFAIGGKPGGMRRWDIGKILITNARGGANIECEDFLNGGLGVEMQEATFDSIIGINIKDENFPGNVSPVEFVKIADKVRRVRGKLISLTDAESSATATACALSVKTGQDLQDVEEVNVDHVAAVRARQALSTEAVAGARIGRINLGSVSVHDVGVALRIRNSGGAASGGIESVSVGYISGKVLSPYAANTGTLIQIDSDTQNVADNSFPPFLGSFFLGGGDISSVRERAFDIRGVKHCKINNLAVLAFTGTPSGDYPQTVHNVIEADDIDIDGLLFRGFFATNQVLELRPKRSCSLRNIDITATGGSSIRFNGSGIVTLSDCILRGGSSGLSFLPSELTFDPATAVNTTTNIITAAAHIFRHCEEVQYTVGTGAIGGLTNNQRAWVIRTDAGSLQLASSFDNARNGVAIAMATATGTGAKIKKALEVDVRRLITQGTTTPVLNSANALSYVQS